MADLWQELAPRWERGRELLWESTRAVSEWLVGRLDPQPGQTILDLAAGTGETGFLAASHLGADGRLITSDLSPNMLEAARRVSALFGAMNAEFRILDAERLELPDASVDGVVSRFGYVLKGDPPPALREVRRVLRRGGRFAFAVWGERERNRWMTVPAEVMVERGHLSPPSEEESRLSAKRNPTAIRSLLGRGVRRARDRGAAGRLPFCERRGALVLRQRAARAGGARAREAGRGGACGRARGDRTPRRPRRRRLRADGGQRERGDVVATMGAVRRLGRVVRQRPAKPFTPVRLW